VILASADGQLQEDGKADTPLETFLTAYYTLRDANAEVVLASPSGGYPIGLTRGDPNEAVAILTRFNNDQAARDELADTLDVDQICPVDFDAGFCIGPPGPIQDDNAGGLVAKLLASGKPVAVMADGVEPTDYDATQRLLIVAGSTGSPAALANALLAAAAGDH
jgi:hypothetical protein